MTPSANLTIGWNEVDKREYVDGLGRTIRWTGLKNKKIYMCGHGAHIYRDGYTTIPAGTTVNFYQVYGQGMMNSRLMRFINGSEQWQPERTFEAGKSCPNMTLFDDDDREITATYEALTARLKSPSDKDDHYIFMCNGFRGLPHYAPTLKPGIPPHAFTGKQFLKLSDILPHLAGNTIEWACCQDIGMERNAYLKNDEAHTFGQFREAVSYRVHVVKSAADAARLQAFSATVREGLNAALKLKKDIENGYNPQGMLRITEPHCEGSVTSTVHGNMKRAPEYYQKQRRAGTPARDRGEMARYRDQIQAALHALDTDPQPQPPFERPWAKDTLTRGLVTVESLLKAF